MKTELKLLAVAGALAFGIQTHASLVADGNFTAAGTPSSFTTYFASQTMGGWTVVSGSVDLIGGYWQSPPGGGNSVDMAGDTSGTISQTISGLVIGQLYQLSFDLSGNPDGPPSIKQLGVGLTIGGGSPYAFSYTIGANTKASMNYLPESELFTATSASEVLQFQDQSDGNGINNPAGPYGTTPWGAVIGDVSLTPVPEPTTIISGVLMLLPFGASTLRILRRNRAA